MASIFKLGQRVPKSEQYPDGWRELYTHRKGVQSEESLLGHKSVLCFPGDGVIYGDEMNGCCKNVEYMLLNAGLPPEEMPSLYSTGFDTDTPGHRQHLLEQAGVTRFGLPKSEPTTDYWTPFFNAYLLPLLQSSDGKARPMAETIQNLQNITFVTHCHGSMFAQQMELLLNEKVKEFYPGKEKEVMGNIRMLHLASRKEVGQNTGVKHLNIVSLADDMYADSGMIAEDHIYKMIHRQNIEERSAIIPVTDNESIMVFKELTTPKTYGEKRSDHSQILRLTAGRGEKTDHDEEALANETGLQFVRAVLRHFVEHPDDPGTVKDIMKQINRHFVASNIQDGQKLSSAMAREKHFEKSFLDFLSQHSLRGVSGDAQMYLQRTSDGEYFYQKVKKHALKTGDFASLRSVLKKVKGYLSVEVVVQEAQEALRRRDRRTMDILTDRMKPTDISEHLLASAEPNDLPFLYPEIKRAQLSDCSRKNLLDDLLKKSEQIQNSSGRVRVQTYLHGEKEKFEAILKERRDRFLINHQ